MDSGKMTGGRFAAYNEGVELGMATVLEIVELCVAAGRPEAACGFLIDGLTLDQVHAVLRAYARLN